MLKSINYDVGHVVSCYKDSRGMKLATGDFVLVMTGTGNAYKLDIFHIIEEYMEQRLVDMEGNGLNLPYRTKYWMIKTNITKKDYNVLIQKSDKLNMEGCSDYRQKVYHISDYASYLEDTYRLKTGISSLRDFGMRDFLDRKLEPGSLVLYSGTQESDKEGNSWSYGIVVSDRQVFTEYLTLATPHHVYLLDAPYTLKETELYSSLVRQLNQMAIKSTGKIRIGDIYRMDSKVYLYLGPCEIVWKKVKNSSVSIEYEQNTKVGRWFDLGNTDMYSINRMIGIDRQYLNERLQKVFKNVSVKKKEYQITDDLFAVYQAVTDFPSLFYEIPEDASFVGNTQLYSEYENAYKESILNSYDVKLKLFGEDNT